MGMTIANSTIQNVVDGALSSLLMILIVLPIILISRYFYKKSDKYKQDCKDEELKKKELQESDDLEKFITLYEEKTKNETKEK